MKHFAMDNRRDKPVRPPPKKSRTTDSAFDIWLNRGLHQLYDDVTREPVPEELLKLIRDDTDT